MNRKTSAPTDTPLPGADQEQVEAHLPLRAPVIYEVVRQEGEIELRRPAASLWWSGIAAGIAICTSLVGEAVLHHHLPDRPWRPMVENFGYCMGFVIAILGRLQLFTENTITAVLPLLANWSRTAILSTVRLWSVVLVANLVGTTAIAAMIVFVGIAPEHYTTAMREVSLELTHLSFGEAFFYSIPAGFLVAAIVWIVPNAEASKLEIVVLLTYFIALGEFAHIIAGSAEVALLIFTGELSFGRGVAGILLPVLAGNIIGGTGLFALLAYGQVREEM